MIKRIIVPTDFSACATNAVRYAAKMAKDIKAEELILTHAYSIPVAYGELAISSISDAILEEQDGEIEASFKNLIQEVDELELINYSYNYKHGMIENTLPLECEEKDIDLIIMGTKGAHNFGEAMLGTNAHFIVKESKIPILIIPENEKYHSVLNIALASDYKFLEPETLEMLKAFNAHFKSEIHIVHISDKQMLNGDEKASAKRFEQYFKNIPHHFHYILDDDIEHGIMHYIKGHDIQVLAVVPRKHNFFERMFSKSESKKLIYHSELPILALPV